MVLLTTGCTLLLGLALLGGYSLHVFTQNNGMFSLIEGFAQRGYLPDGTIYSPQFTGVKGVDEVLNILVQFFWPVVDGKHPDVAVVGGLLLAQGVAGWTTTMLEGMRFGTSRIVSFTTPVGMLVQLFGFGLIGPLYLFVHLLTVTFGNGRKVPTLKSISIAEHQLHALPWATTFGFVLPSIIMGLPSPDILNTKAKIAAILLWQPFPVWTAIFTRLFSGSSTTTTTTTTAASSPRHTLAALRKVYRNTFYFASLIHVLALTHGILTIVSPETLGKFYSPQLHPMHLYIPQNPFSAAKASTIAEGAFWFLQWDYTVTSIAYLVWAISLKYSQVTSVSLPTLVYQAVIRPIVLGPMATALALIWERDEYLFARELKAGGTKKRS